MGRDRDREGPKNFGYIFVSAIKPFPLCSDAWLAAWEVRVCF